MDALLKLTPADQLDAYLEVNREMGLDAASVEKVFWVCWTLREIFALPGIGGHITFNPSPGAGTCRLHRHHLLRTAAWHLLQARSLV